MSQEPQEASKVPETKENGFSLANILDGNGSIEEKEDEPKVSEDEPQDDKETPEGFCVECEDQPAEVRCSTCADNFCQVCFTAQHRKGSRKRHAVQPLGETSQKRAKIAALDAHKGDEQSKDAKMKDSDDETDSDDSDDELEEAYSGPPMPVGSQPASGDWFLERAKHIPLRLTLNERKFLRLLEAALNVSEYTDKIDVIGFGLSKAKRIVSQIKELCAIMSGLVVAEDYSHGQELLVDRDFQANADFFQKIFELGRRHKIMNPDKMRATYGKLIYLLQDAQTPEVKDLLSFSCVKPIKTVYTVLEHHSALDLLKDELVPIATKEIYSEGRVRREVQKEIKLKERAIETLANRYSQGSLTDEQVRQCLYSIGDNHAFLRTNRDPCERMISYLKEYFHPTNPGKDEGSGLAIRSGRGGARLSHDHSKQYAYVIQSLTLWREILHDMFHLWSLAEQDLLSETVRYRLVDTGQGLNRVQGAPKTSRMMHAILGRAQNSVGSWVGSSVIHLGDRDVPNALMFIDKYSQIYRILLPICTTLSKIDTLKSPAMDQYITSEFGSKDGLFRAILGDFFRHGFDGSGADNFYDAGSCIDGRLTSAWNWCQSLEKKKYFPVFLLTGFIGFDGDW